MGLVSGCFSSWSCSAHDQRHLSLTLQRGIFSSICAHVSRLSLGNVVGILQVVCILGRKRHAEWPCEMNTSEYCKQCNRFVVREHVAPDTWNKQSQALLRTQGGHRGLPETVEPPTIEETATRHGCCFHFQSKCTNLLFMLVSV